MLVENNTSSHALTPRGRRIFEFTRTWAIKQITFVGLDGLALASVGLGGASGLARGLRVGWTA